MIALMTGAMLVFLLQLQIMPKDISRNGGNILGLMVNKDTIVPTREKHPFLQRIVIWGVLTGNRRTGRGTGISGRRREGMRCTCRVTDFEFIERLI